MRRNRWTLLLLLPVTLGLVAGAVPAASSQPAVTVVADRLNNPRGLEFAQNGLYVAETGRGGPRCLPDGTCVGNTGALTRVRPGKVRALTGLISGAGEDGTFAGGASDVSVAQGKLYTVFTSIGCGPLPPGLPGSARRQLGNLVRADRNGDNFEVVADIDAFECANNPDDDTPGETNPYSVLALSDQHQVVTDAAGNTLLDVNMGHVSLLAVFPENRFGADPVPTSVALGPDGAYYVGELGGEGTPAGGSRVWRVVPGQPPRVYARGFSAITDLTFGPDGSLYVCEFTTDPATFAPTGDIVRVRPNGSRTRLGVGALFFPGGVAVSGQGEVFVSNWSILPATGPGFPGFPGSRGQVVKLHG